MLSVLATTWLLLQLPVGVVLGRILACPQRQVAKRTEASHPPLSNPSRAA